MLKMVKYLKLELSTVYLTHVKCHSASLKDPEYPRLTLGNLCHGAVWELRFKPSTKILSGKWDWVGGRENFFRSVHLHSLDFYNKQHIKVIRDFSNFFYKLFFFHFKKRSQKNSKSESEWGWYKEMKNEIKSLLAQGQRTHSTRTECVCAFPSVIATVVQIPLGFSSLAIKVQAPTSRLGKGLLPVLLKRRLMETTALELGSNPNSATHLLCDLEQGH